jgi:GT2 family glycosyltransferase
MSERYFLYYEEMDWAVRNAGRFRVGFARGAIVYHKHGGSIGSSAVKGGRSALSDYYMLRSRLLFYRQHQPLLLPLIWVQGAAQTGMRLMRRQPEKAMKMARALFGLSY